VADGDAFRETRKDMERAIRRLNILEYVIMVAAVLVALAGGGLVAFLLSAGSELPFRPTWAVISLLLIAVPAAAVFGRERMRTAREKREKESRDSGAPPHAQRSDPAEPNDGE
jgi:predicted lysophospholipase L1 biosynthesis ABC-type transport system permease subunit